MGSVASVIAAIELESNGMHSGIQNIVNDGSGSGKHMRKHVAFANGAGKDSSSVHSILPRENKNARIQIGGNGLECYPLISTKELEASSSSSSSDSSDFFQVDANKGVKLEARTNPSTKSHENIADESDVSISSSIESRNIDDVSIGTTSVSLISDGTRESILPAMSPIQSPETQRMDRSEGYDPFRIPSSVFDRSKSTTPIDWSVASNESLFSIHVGNSSFARDHVLMLGDLGKSGELTKSGELFVLNPLPQVPRVESREKGVETINESLAGEVTVGIIQDEKTGAEYQKDRILTPPEVSWNSSNASQQSDGSGTSAHSFAFPIFEDGKNSSSVVKDEKEQESRVFVKPHKSKLSRWFACFSCCHWGCSCCCSCSGCRSCSFCRSCSNCLSCSFCRSCSKCRSCSNCRSCPCRRCCSCSRSCSCLRNCSSLRNCSCFRSCFSRCSCRRRRCRCCC